MHKLLIGILLLNCLLCANLKTKAKQPISNLSDNILIGIFNVDEKLYVSTNGTTISTSSQLRANEQFILKRSQNFWCFESNNYMGKYISLNISSLKNVSISCECGENEQFDIINRVDIGKEYYAIRSVKYDVYITIERNETLYEAMEDNGNVNAQNLVFNTTVVLFQFMNATKGDVM